MKRLDRYLVREMVVPFLIGQCAVVLMLTGTVLYNNASVFLDYHIPALGVAKIAFYFMPYLVNLTMPVAMAIAGSLAVSRLSRDSEITVMRAAGVSIKRIFLPIFAVGLVLSFADFYFGEKVVPWSNLQYERTMSYLSRNISFLAPQEGQVVQSPDKRYTIVIGRMQAIGKTSSRAKLYDVMVIIRGPGGTMGAGAITAPRVILAETADYDEGKWKLYDASIHVYRNHGMDDTVTHAIEPVEIDFRLAERMFNLIALQLPLYSANSEASTSSFRQLGERLDQQRKAGWVNKRDLLEYHFKLSVPFSCLVFALVCPPLSLRFARAGGFMGVLLSIILVFVYWNTLLAAKILGATFPDKIPPFVAAWGQNVLFSGIGLYFLWRGE